MRAKKMSQVAFFAISVFSCYDSYAQSGLAKYEWGLNLGAYVYQGDLAPGSFGSLKTIRPGIGISFARIISSSFSLRANLNVASLRGDETKYDYPDYRKNRAFKFTNSVKELTLMGKWNVLGSMQYETKFEPYLFAGVGVGFLNVTRDFSQFNAAFFNDAGLIQEGITQDLAERTRRTIVEVPVGVGLRYNISSSIALNLETTYRITESDYIDGFSYAVNPFKNDQYYSQTIGVSFKLGNNNKNTNKLGCPAIKY